MDEWDWAGVPESAFSFHVRHWQNMEILPWRKTKRMSNLTFVYIMNHDVWSNMKGWLWWRTNLIPIPTSMHGIHKPWLISFRTPDLWLSIMNLNSVEERKWMHVFPKSLKASPPRWNRVKASHHATKHYGNMHACLEPSESSGADLFFALLLFNGLRGVRRIARFVSTQCRRTQSGQSRIDCRRIGKPLSFSVRYGVSVFSIQIQRECA